MFQIKANARWLQVTRYEVMRALNNTRDGLNAINEELRPLRLMFLQHRYVLNMLTAMESGVCRKIRKSCCTFIPANNAPNGSLTKAIEDLDNLGKKSFEEGGARADIAMDWFDFSWMPSWLSALLKILVPVCGVLLLLCCVVQIMCHCVKRFSNKAVGMNYARTGIYRKSIHEDSRPGNGDKLALLEVVELTTSDSHLLQTTTDTQYQVPSAPPPLPPGRHPIRKDHSIDHYECLVDRPEGEYVEFRTQLDKKCPYANDTLWMPQQDKGPAKYAVRVLLKNE